MKKNIIISMVFIAGLALLTTLLYIVTTSSPATLSEDDTVKIAASIFPIYDIARHVAGDEVEVVLILPSGVSPHTYEPKPKDLKNLEGSDIILTTGLEVDHWVESLGLDQANLVELHNDVDLIIRQSDDDDVNDFTDSHFWLSPINAQKIFMIRVWP